MKIKDLCASERPREKLLAEGAGRLSNGELLAVLLRSGMRNLSAVELAQQLLNACDAKLCNLFNMDCGRLCAIPGIGKDKAATVMAALELGRRFLHEESAFDRKAIVTARSVFEIMLPRLKGLRHEECWMLLLNDSCYLIKCVMLKFGRRQGDSHRRTAGAAPGSGQLRIGDHPGAQPSERQSAAERG